jgi:hypothetical protein
MMSVVPEKKRCAWDLVTQRDHKKCKRHLIVKFNADDNVGGASPHIFFFYYQLVRYNATQECSNAWLQDSIIGSDDFCRPFLTTGDYAYMDKDGRS